MTFPTWPLAFPFASGRRASYSLQCQDISSKWPDLVACAKRHSLGVGKLLKLFFARATLTSFPPMTQETVNKIYFYVPGFAHIYQQVVQFQYFADKIPFQCSNSCLRRQKSRGQVFCLHQLIALLTSLYQLKRCECACEYHCLCPLSSTGWIGGRALICFYSDGHKGLRRTSLFTIPAARACSTACGCWEDGQSPMLDVTSAAPLGNVLLCDCHIDSGQETARD